MIAVVITATVITDYCFLLSPTFTINTKIDDNYNNISIYIVFNIYYYYYDSKRW